VVILSPGQDTALTIRNTLLGGRGGGIATAAGVVTGLATWTIASSAGLAALLVASQPLFLAVRLVGAGYLIFLGLQALYGAVRGPHRADAVRPASGSRPRSALGYRPALLSHLSKPRRGVASLNRRPHTVSPCHAS